MLIGRRLNDYQTAVDASGLGHILLGFPLCARYYSLRLFAP